MVGGVDRYYQIARCLRDEDLRADRQYEFMQLDAEMSFVDQDDVLAVHLRGRARRRRGGHRASGPAPIPRITWHEAMDRFGVDKPDLRFGMELVELTDGVRRDRLQGLRRRAVREGHPRAGRRRRLRPQQARRPHRPGQALGRQGPGVDARSRGRRRRSTSPVAKFLSDDEQAGRRRRARAPSRATCCCSWPTSGPTGVRGARPAAHRPRAARRCTRAATATCGSSTSRCSSASTTHGRPEARPTTRSPCPTPTTSTGSSRDPMDGAVAGLRPRAQRVGARLGHRSGSTSPTCSSASSTCSASTPRRPTSASASSSTPFRYGAPPHGGFAFGIDRLVGHPRRRGEHPRGHRLPEDAVGHRPDDQRARRRSTTRQLPSSACASCRRSPDREPARRQAGTMSKAFATSS